MSHSAPQPKPASRPNTYAPVQTRGGLHVEVLYHTRAPLVDGREIVGIVTDTESNPGSEPIRTVETWFGDGRYYFGRDSAKDLVNS